MDSFVEASGWIFVQKDPIAYYRVVCWEKMESGDIVGLISVTGSTDDSGHIVNKLVPPPPLAGRYVHIDDLTEEERVSVQNQNKKRSTR